MPLYFLSRHQIIAKTSIPLTEKTRWKEKQAVLFCTFAKNILFTDLGIPFSEFLEHVGVGPLVLFVMFLNLALAYGNLSTSCPIGGVDLQHLLKVCHGQAEFITKEPRFPSAVQSLLVVLVELHHLTRQHQTQRGAVGHFGCTAKRKRRGSGGGRNGVQWAKQRQALASSPCCSSPPPASALSFAGSTTLG